MQIRNIVATALSALYLLGAARFASLGSRIDDLQGKYECRSADDGTATHNFSQISDVAFANTHIVVRPNGSHDGWQENYWHKDGSWFLWAHSPQTSYRLDARAPEPTNTAPSWTFEGTEADPRAGDAPARLTYVFQGGHLAQRVLQRKDGGDWTTVSLEKCEKVK